MYVSDIVTLSLSGGQFTSTAALPVNDIVDHYKYYYWPEINNKVGVRSLNLLYRTI